MHDLADRLANRVQLTTDGHKAYLNAVEDAFGAQIDYAMLIKIYGNTPEGGATIIAASWFESGLLGRLGMNKHCHNSNHMGNISFFKLTHYLFLFLLASQAGVVHVFIRRRE